MTIKQAIDTTDELKPNQYSFDDKVRWLGNLDGMIFIELLCTHEGPAVTEFSGYEAADHDTQLLAAFPYDEDIYVNYLSMQIDRLNGEMNRYNADKLMFDTVYTMYRNWYNRTHTPRTVPHALRV